MVMPTATAASDVAACADPQALQDQWVELFLQRIDGALDAHRLFHAVDRERHMHIPTAEAGVADFFRGVQHVRCVVEFGEQANDLRPFDPRAVARAIAGLPPE